MCFISRIATLETSGTTLVSMDIPPLLLGEKIMKLRALLLPVLCFGLLATAPNPARAASCSSMINDLYNFLGSGYGVVEFLHTTNYQAHGYWETAQGSGQLLFVTGRGLMRGRDDRTWSDGHTDNYELYFDPNGAVWFGPYGPYTPSCYSNKFLVVNSGDSYETLTFIKYRP